MGTFPPLSPPTMKLVRLLILFSLVIGAGSASAQATAPAAAPAPAAAAAPPPPKCNKPDHYMGNLSTDRYKKTWQKDVQAWGDCMKQYVADLQAQINDLQARTDALIKPANAAIKEYNTGMKEFQEEFDKSQ
jgi:hypothetical protein